MKDHWPETESLPEPIECDICKEAMPEQTESGCCARCDAEWTAKQQTYQPVGIAAVLDQIMERFKPKNLGKQEPRSEHNRSRTEEA